MNKQIENTIRKSKAYNNNNFLCWFTIELKNGKNCGLKDYRLKCFKKQLPFGNEIIDASISLSAYDLENLMDLLESSRNELF